MAIILLIFNFDVNHLLSMMMNGGEDEKLAGISREGKMGWYTVCWVRNKESDWNKLDVGFIMMEVE